MFDIFLLYSGFTHAPNQHKTRFLTASQKPINCKHLSTEVSRTVAENLLAFFFKLFTLKIKCVRFVIVFLSDYTNRLFFLNLLNEQNEHRNLLRNELWILMDTKRFFLDRRNWEKVKHEDISVLCWSTLIFNQRHPFL